MRSSGWTTGRVIGMVACSIVVLLGILIALAGAAAIALQAFARDDDGFMSSDSERLSAPAFAITAEDIDLGSDPAGWTPQRLLGTVRISAEGERPVFIGIGPEARVRRYLAGVGRAELTDFGFGDTEYRLQAGGPPPRPPGAERFWVAASRGPGEQEIEWDVDAGRWSVVVMNADGARGVAVDVTAAVRIEWLLWAGVVALVIGIVLIAVPVFVIVSISRSASRPPGDATPPAPPAA